MKSYLTNFFSWTVVSVSYLKRHCQTQCHLDFAYVLMSCLKMRERENKVEGSGVTILWNDLAVISST